MFASRPRATMPFLAVALVFGGAHQAAAQVAAEPTMLTARVPATETFLAYVAFPDNSFAFGGMLRFPVAHDVDIGGRAGLWLIEGADDTPFAGADVRYGLLSRGLDPGGGVISVSLNLGLGLSDPGPTIWKLPLGFIAGIGFGLGPGDAELFANPRLELGLASGADDTDAALLIDIGSVIPIQRNLAIDAAIRFGEGVFGEGDQLVVGLGGLWRI